MYLKKVVKEIYLEIMNLRVTDGTFVKKFNLLFFKTKIFLMF